MSYIPFTKINNSSCYGSVESTNMARDYRWWLVEHAGAQDFDWRWHVGDLYAQGVHIYDEEIAILFKLKFDV